MKRIITIALVCLSLQMSAQCWQSIEAGNGTTNAKKADGTIWGWGSNGAGQIGNGGTTNANTPQQVGNNTNDWQSISVGTGHSVAIKSNGTIWSWGSNNYGQLGNGSTTFAYVPTQIGTETNWQSIFAVYNQTFAIKTDGTLWAWGVNTYGQLGDNTLVNKYVPTQIGTDTNWLKISGGVYHTVAIKTDGTLWCWGRNNYGQNGSGTTADVYVPTQLGSDTDWQSLSRTGEYHTLAIKTNGTLWGWGNNISGQLGDGTNVNKNVVTQIGTENNWIKIATGWDHTMALKTDGTLWGWGSNGFGCLGLGTTITSTYTPIQVGTLTTWQNIGAGSLFSFGIKTDGSLWCWGYNNYGNLGEGTTTNRTTPTSISCPTSILNTPNFDENNSILGYPNPIKDILNLLFDKQITSVSMYNLLGQEVLTKVINATEGAIDTSSLAKGTYMVKVSSNDGVKTLKVIKE